MAVLSAVFTACVRDFGWLKIKFDAGKMKAPPNPSNVLGTKKETGKHNRQALTPKEIERLLDVCSENQKLHVVIYLALVSRVRREKIWSLKRHQVDWDKGDIDIGKDKNGEDHTIFMVGEAENLLLELAKAEGWAPRVNVVRKVKHIWPNSQSVFPSRYKPDKPYNLRIPFERAVKKAKLGDFQWHDIRRTVCTLLLMAGVPTQMIIQIQNWKDGSMITLYAQLNNLQVKEWQEKGTATYLPK